MSDHEEDWLGKIRSDYRPDRERFPFENKWPEDVWSIGVERMDLLGVDDRGNLYWDGKELEVNRRLDFTRWQIVFGIVGLVIAAVAAAAACASAWADVRMLDAERSKAMVQPLSATPASPSPGPRSPVR